MSTEKRIIEIEPRESQPCELCGARNTDTRKIRIATKQAGDVAAFYTCRSCLKQTAIDICAAYFEFMETLPARSPDPELKK